MLITRDDYQLVDITVHPPAVSNNDRVIASVPFLHETQIHVEVLLRNWKAW